MISLKHTLRIVSKNKLSFTINTIGLTLGISIFLMLFAYVNHEISYDKHFANYDRVVRMLISYNMENGEENIPITDRKISRLVPEQIPEVEKAFQLMRVSESELKHEEKSISHIEVQMVDSTFFSLFGWPLLSATNEPFTDEKSILLSESSAQRLFGTTDVIGQKVNLYREDYSITGIYKDIPQNSHLRADVMVPMPKEYESWTSLEFNTYFLLKEGSDMTEVIGKIETLHNAHLKEWGANYDIKMRSTAEPLKGMHLYTKADFDLRPIGDVRLVAMLTTIAIVILIIALFNSTNLFMASGQKRLKEIAIRRTAGASSQSIIKQLIYESAIINLFSLLLGLGIAIKTLPIFNEIIVRDIPTSTLFEWRGLSMTIGLYVLSTLLSALYPAFMLTKYNTNEIFKQNQHSKKSSSWLSQSMIIGQLVAAILMIFTFVAIQQHIHFLKGSDLGLNPKNTIVFGGLNNALKGNYPNLKDEVLQIPGVTTVAFSSHRMGHGYSGQAIKLHGSDEKQKDLNVYRVRPDFCKVFELDLLWGRFYKESDLGDGQRIILNKTAADRLGLKPNDTRTIDLGDWKTNVEVIGVVKDFAYEGNNMKIAPLSLSYIQTDIYSMSIRYTANIPAHDITNKVKTIINRYDPEYIGDTEYPEEYFNNKYSEEERVLSTIGISGIIALFICLIGIYAITVLNLQKRLKELALRKIMGASVQSIQTLYLKKYIKQLLIAALIALPIGTLIMQEYFKNYPKHESINPLFYILSIVVPLIIICTIVAIRVLYTAKQNPVKSLRYE